MQGFPGTVQAVKLRTANMQSDLETDLRSYFHLELIYLVICKDVEIRNLPVIDNLQLLEFLLLYYDNFLCRLTYIICCLFKTFRNFWNSAPTQCLNNVE
jgi:hypothetical protein